MTVKEIIALLQALPPDYEIAVDRGGAYESAQSIERNDALHCVFICSEAPGEEIVSVYPVTPESKTA